MDNKVRIIIKKPQQYPKEIYVEDKLENWQKILEGYLESIYFDGKIYMLVNEEGKLKNLEPNIYFRSDILVGNVIFVAVNDNGDFIDLNDSEIEKIYEFLD